MTEAGPDFEIERSVLGVTGVVAVALLFDDAGSGVVVEAVAVFVMVEGVE